MNTKTPMNLKHNETNDQQYSNFSLPKPSIWLKRCHAPFYRSNTQSQRWQNYNFNINSILWKSLADIIQWTTQEKYNTKELCLLVYNCMTFKCWYCVKRNYESDSYNLEKNTKCSWQMAHTILRAFNDIEHTKQRNYSYMFYGKILLNMGKVANILWKSYRTFAVLVTAIFAAIIIPTKYPQFFWMAACLAIERTHFIW